MTQNLSVTSLLIVVFFCGINGDGFAGTAQVHSDDPFCDYIMCQYEKGNIDEIILSRAQESQTVMFGEIHDSVMADDPPPLEDSSYVISLLQSLRSLGYNYLALEVTKSVSPKTHSHDVIKFTAEYRRGHAPLITDYPYAKPGWLDLVKAAVDNNYELVFINRSRQGLDRDKAMFEALKNDIFDHDPMAKVLVYIGANHISEIETSGGFSNSAARRKPLGVYLNDYTHGHNFSVYMGYPWDTPVGCDLFISHFIWNIYQK